MKLHYNIKERFDFISPFLAADDDYELSSRP